MPAAPAVYAPRLGPASSACVLLPAQVSRLRRLPFAAVAHSGCAVCPSRRCAYTASALGMACRGFDMRRSGRFLAAARTPLRQMGCCSLALLRGWWWGVDVLAALTEERRARLRGDVACGPPHGRHALASGAPDPRGSRSPRQPRSRLRRHRGLPDPRRPRPPSPGSRNACAGSQPPPAPAPRLSPQGSGRSRSHARVRARRSVSPPRLGRSLIAPARPSSAPRGAARAPAPRPGLRCRHPNRRGSQRTRQTPLRASQRPRPRRTTWLGTPTAP